MVDEIDIESGEGGKVIKEYKHIHDINQATKAFNRFIKYKPKIISLPNLGRESHTWLYHIVNNYHELDDINIFLQGKVDDLGCMAYLNPNQYIKNIFKMVAHIWTS